MIFKEPKNNKRYSWTKHSIQKMKFYGLTPQRVLRVLKKPDRCQEGIVENCIACMQSLKNKAKSEIWVMYTTKIKSFSNEKLDKNHKRIITAWRYPAVSPVQDEIPIPTEILEEVQNMEFLSL